MRQLVLRGLRYYWRSNLAVVLGVATAVAVLAGALLVGDSVRGSLRDLVLDRLGRTTHVIVSTSFFREALADDIRAEAVFSASFEGIVPLATAQGFVTAQGSGRTLGQVRVYGVDDRFWRFHGVDGVAGPSARDALVSPALAEELGVGPEATLLVRVARPTDVPLESLHSRKDAVGRTLRLTVSRVLAPDALGEFSLEPQQAAVRAVFVPLARLQQEFEAPGRVNALLVSAKATVTASTTSALESWARAHTTLEDLDLSVVPVPATGGLAVTSKAGLLDDARVAAVNTALRSQPSPPQPLFTYLANSMRVGDREVPYSLVTALDTRTLAAGDTWPARDTPTPGADPIVLNAWAADALRARVGDTLTMDYFVWEDPGQLATRQHEFRVSGIVPLEAGDLDMAPQYPGISDSPTLDDWDPPFPVDLSRVTKADEDYWARYRTTPKAFVPLEVGQRLWRSRYGAVSSIRILAPAGQSVGEARARVARDVRAALDPLALGLTVRDVRAEGVDASRGATDFGEYFIYFSFFLVVSALLLASLFFKLGIEQRVREVGLLRAVGFGPSEVRWLFLTEGVVLAAAGSLLGVLGAVGYAGAIMAALGSWWVDAVGTTALALHVTTESLVIGAVGGVVAGVACVAGTLRSLGRISERSLLAGELAASSTSRGRVLPVVTALFALIGLALFVVGVRGGADAAGAFFGVGFAWLGAGLGLVALRLRARSRHALTGVGWAAVARLGWRHASHRPGRSVLSMAVIACATFILVSVDAFRRGDALADAGRASGVGGYSLLVETVLPVVRDPNSTDGRNALNLFALDASTRIEPFRLLPGDDASCLNLYAPTSPRILAPRDSFLDEGRFAFQSSLATTDEERRNPWLLLRQETPDGAIPVIGDANSMQYVLHRQLGEEMVIARGGREIRLRFVAALRDSLFQGELLMSQANFVRAFPDAEGARVFLVEGGGADVKALAATFEDALIDSGADATSTVERLAAFHRVENTYLTTFQTLGGLGLLLGTVGLATVLLRNVLERRRELALLGAVGYERRDILNLVLSENAMLLVGGLGIGGVCAALAIMPTVLQRGGWLPIRGAGALLLAGVFVVGLLSSGLAIRAALRAPLLASLRSE